MARLIGAQRMVLQAILDLQKDAAGYVTDSQIAQTTQIAITDVRDWIETLEGEGHVEVARTKEGLKGSITAKGRLILRRSPLSLASPTRPDRSSEGEGQFRRIYYEGFDGDLFLKKRGRKKADSMWLVGKKGHWTGNIADGVHRLSNTSGPDAVLNNRFRYFEPESQPVDLGDCKVSVRVRVEPPNDSHSGGGLVFRCSEGQETYYAYLLHPGHSVSLAEVTEGKLSFLCTLEAPGVVGSSFVTLKLIGRGQRILFYADNHHIHTLHDAAFRTGSPGIMALSIGHFVYDDFAIFLRSDAS